MTPETLAFLGSLVERYGLPLILLVGLGWALLTRRITLGSEMNYDESRRVEEREAKLLAEATLREQAQAMAKLSDSFETMTDTLLEAFEDSRGPRRQLDAIAASQVGHARIPRGGGQPGRRVFRPWASSFGRSPGSA